MERGPAPSRSPRFPDARRPGALDALPDTNAALGCGEVTMDEARHIASVVTEDTEKEWLSTVPWYTAPWYTAPDFARLVELTSRGVPVLQIASEVVDKLVNEPKLTDRVTFTGLRRQMPARRHPGTPAPRHPGAPAPRRPGTRRSPAISSRPQSGSSSTRAPSGPRSPNVAAAASRSETASAAATPSAAAPPCGCTRTTGTRGATAAATSVDRIRGRQCLVIQVDGEQFVLPVIDHPPVFSPFGPGVAGHDDTDGDGRERSAILSYNSLGR